MDSDAVYNALFNLITNAFDAFDKNDAFDTGDAFNTEENSENKARADKEVTVSVEKELDWIVYRVEDNGEGMDENISRSLFKEFITTKGAHGTGFGLMTTKKIIDEHNGLIFFETRKGKGSVFTMKIPLQPQGGSKG
ncbi:MAG: ATP-binding protein, partial [Desulfobacteraceae bacterium]|nr:ATP-binding protein [Desulfobacteraceae bacterium]